MSPAQERPKPGDLAMAKPILSPWSQQSRRRPPNRRTAPLIVPRTLTAAKLQQTHYGD